MLQIIDDEDQQEPESRPEMELIELLMDYFIHELSFKNNFEFIQAVIRLFLKVLHSNSSDTSLQFCFVVQLSENFYLCLPNLTDSRRDD